MAKRSKVAQEAYDIAKPYAEKLGLELIDAEYKKEGQDMFLRLIVDKEGGMSSDDCENLSRIVDPIFDEKLKADPDYFEVSSPGLTRPLTEADDFRRYKDELIEVNLFKAVEGHKSFLGRIKDINEESVVFEVLENKSINKAVTKYVTVAELDIKYDMLSKAIRHIEF